MTASEQRISGTVVSFDYGIKRIGVAVGQTVTGTAAALETLISRNGPDWAAITRLIETWRPVALVIGVPYHLDGTEHELTRAARRFGNRLQGRYHLPVFSVDERLTSIEAEELLAERRRGGREHKADIDKVAAQVILQSWLDNRNEH